MSDITPLDMAAKLVTGGFARSGPPATAISDPAVDTPMVLTLNQLRAYDHDPRVTRNPRHDEIKASIRERGLDAPPSVTRRPNEPHFIIRNGGNTRLAILNELWSETKLEQFFRIPCLFRPWSARGEIVALTGHLVENELRGGLTFIERALGVEKARAFYEAEMQGKSLSQSELARRLAADGYPVPQPHISRMREAVQYLLPAIPNVLYGGLGRHQVERLATLRNAGERVWAVRSQGKRLVDDFPTLFQDVLSIFDGELASFAPQRVQDELVGQMAQILEVDYDLLALEISDSESRDLALRSEPNQPHTTNTIPSVPSTSVGTAPVQPAPRAELAAITPEPALPDEAPPQEPVAMPPPAHRLHSIQHLVSDMMEERLEDSLEAEPIASSADGLFPVADIWRIESSLEAPDRLRVHIAQFAREIAGEVGIAGLVEPVHEGLGFVCLPRTDNSVLPPVAQAVMALLDALSAGTDTPDPAPATSTMRFVDVLKPLLMELSDTGLKKLFRLLRLARRLLELEAADNTEP